MSRYRLFAGELDGELVLCHIGPRARDVRISIGQLFNYGHALTFYAPEIWAAARKAGWKVVPVAVEKLPDNSRRGMARNFAHALRDRSDPEGGIPGRA